MSDQRTVICEFCGERVTELSNHTCRPTDLESSPHPAQPNNTPTGLRPDKELAFEAITKEAQPSPSIGTICYKCRQVIDGGNWKHLSSGKYVHSKCPEVQPTSAIKNGDRREAAEWEQNKARCESTDASSNLLRSEMNGPQPTSELPCPACCKFPSQSDEGGSGPKCPECGKFAIVPCKPTIEQSHAAVNCTDRFCLEHQQLWDAWERIMTIRAKVSNRTSPVSVGAEQDARAVAVEILSNCAAKYVSPTGYSRDPQIVINEQIDRAAERVAAYARHREERLKPYLRHNLDCPKYYAEIYWKIQRDVGMCQGPWTCTCGLERILKG